MQRHELVHAVFLPLREWQNLFSFIQRPHTETVGVGFKGPHIHWTLSFQQKLLFLKQTYINSRSNMFPCKIGSDSDFEDVLKLQVPPSSCAQASTWTSCLKFLRCSSKLPPSSEAQGTKNSSLKGPSPHSQHSLLQFLPRPWDCSVPNKRTVPWNSPRLEGVKLPNTAAGCFSVPGWQRHIPPQLCQLNPAHWRRKEVRWEIELEHVSTKKQVIDILGNPLVSRFVKKDRLLLSKAYVEDPICIWNHVSLKISESLEATMKTFI